MQATESCLPKLLVKVNLFPYIVYKTSFINKQTITILQTTIQIYY